MIDVAGAPHAVALLQLGRSGEPDSTASARADEQDASRAYAASTTKTQRRLRDSNACGYVAAP
jgi:hypothetical protein